MENFRNGWAENAPHRRVGAVVAIRRTPFDGRALETMAGASLDVLCADYVKNRFVSLKGISEKNSPVGNCRASWALSRAPSAGTARVGLQDGMIDRGQTAPFRFKPRRADAPAPVAVRSGEAAEHGSPVTIAFRSRRRRGSCAAPTYLRSRASRILLPRPAAVNGFFKNNRPGSSENCFIASCSSNPLEMMIFISGRMRRM
jgi:hypothetical protein